MKSQSARTSTTTTSRMSTSMNHTDESNNNVDASTSTTTRRRRTTPNNKEKEEEDMEMALNEDSHRESSASSVSSTSSSDRRANKELANKKVIIGKLIMLVVLAISTAAVSTAVFRYLRGTERDAYEEQYSNDADKVFLQVRQTLDLTLAGLDNYVVSIVAYNLNNKQWPYITVPNFAVQAAKIRGLTKGFLVSQYHKITDNTSMAETWENYTAANDDWVNESLQIQLNDPTFLGKRIETYDGGASALDLHPNPPLDQNGRAMYFPKWQSSPLIPAWDPYNWDLNNLDLFSEFILPELLRHKAVISPATNVPLENSQQAKDVAQGNIGWFREILDENQNPAYPSSDLYYPVLSYAADAVLHNISTGAHNNSSVTTKMTDDLVGVVSLSFFWGDFFQDILPKGSDGLIAVVANTCGQSFTYELTGPTVTLLGIEDLHDSNYDNMKRSTSLHFDPVYTTTALPLGNDLCSFHLTTYPSTTFEDRFYSNDPAAFAVAVVLTFVFSALVFLLYDFFVEARQRTVQYNELRANVDAEKSKLILDNARQATRAERELNDFIAHEVRNPVSAAMAACSFVKSAVKSDNLDPESIQTIREDVQVIDHSLNFVADLLRNMLDMHRAADKKLKITLEPVDILHDILEPTGGMLYRRGDNVKLLIECPKNLVVETDRLRLKQVVLNLGRNSSKFISKGYIRLRARVVPEDGTVEISVEDSGSGVPIEKQGLLFQKFQDSLDVLSQGTGIGLFLCKNLVDLMEGEISLDDEFDSGVPGFPGTRIAIRLNKQPSDILESVGKDDGDIEEGNNNVLISSDQKGWLPQVTDDGETSSSSVPLEAQYKLPEKLRVLFVDDDAMLRKLFSRSIQRVAPDWTCQEAGNGEAALLLTETQEFDIIFMDMYMASVEKQLLGTETVVELRSQGVNCHIFGLSANDKEEEFLRSGADGFVFKPFPCKTDLLRAELGRLLSQRHPAFNKDKTYDMA